MDEGQPIAYLVLEDGVPVYSSDGQMVGSVDHVLAAPEEDIFHGLIIDTASGRRFVAADQIAELHDRGVDLLIDADAVATLPEPHGGAPAARVNEPGVKPSRWQHFVDRFTHAETGRKDWREED
jgi:hypothetical protein